MFDIVCTHIDLKNKVSKYKKKINYNRFLLFKRIFFLLIILVITKNTSAQLFTQSMPLWEPLLINPAYAGAADCKRANLQFQRQINYDYATFSYLHHFTDKNISLATPITNRIEGKSINNFTAGIIFSKSIEINKYNIMSFALQADYLQQNIISENLIFRHQIDPLNGNVSAQSHDYKFPVVRLADFSAGILFHTPSIRAGIAYQNLSGLYKVHEELKIKPSVTVHFGKSIKFSSHRKNKLIIPEFFTQYTDKHFRFAFGTSIYYGIFSGQIILKHIPTNKSFWATAGIRIKHKKISYGYAYQWMIAGDLAQGLSSHSINISLKYQCKSKRNKKNTIFCAIL